MKLFAKLAAVGVASAILAGCVGEFESYPHVYGPRHHVVATEVYREAEPSVVVTRFHERRHFRSPERVVVTSPYQSRQTTVANGVVVSKNRAQSGNKSVVVTRVNKKNSDEQQEVAPGVVVSHPAN